jgi:hypothetical protein
MQDLLRDGRIVTSRRQPFDQLPLSMDVLDSLENVAIGLCQRAK